MSQAAKLARYFEQRTVACAAYAITYWGVSRCVFCRRWLTAGAVWCDGGCSPRWD